MATEVMIDYDMQNPKKKKSKPKTIMMKKLGKAAGEAYKNTSKDLEEIGLKMAEKYKSKFTPAENSERCFNLTETALDKLKPGSRPMTVEEGEAFLNGAKSEDIKSGKYKKEDVMMAPSLRYATDEEIKESRSKTPAKKDLNDKVNNEVNSIFSEMKKRKLESLKKPATKKD